MPLLSPAYGSRKWKILQELGLTWLLKYEVYCPRYILSGPQVISIVLLSSCDVIFEARIRRKSGTFDIFYVNRG